MDDEPEYRFLNAKSCAAIFAWIQKYHGFQVALGKSHHAPEWCGKTGYALDSGIAMPGDTIVRIGRRFGVVQK